MNHVKPTYIQQHRHIAMLTYPDCMLIDVCGPMDVFNFANHALRMLGRISPSEIAYTLTIVAENSGSVKTSSGICIVADKGYEDLDEGVDTLLVTGSASVDSAVQVSIQPCKIQKCGRG